MLALCCESTLLFLSVLRGHETCECCAVLRMSMCGRSDKTYAQGPAVSVRSRGEPIGIPMFFGRHVNSSGSESCWRARAQDCSRGRVSNEQPAASGSMPMTSRAHRPSEGDRWGNPGILGIGKKGVLAERCLSIVGPFGGLCFSHLLFFWGGFLRLRGC